jgi:hypothetical protein
LTVEENAGMPEIYRFVVDYEYQEKKGNLSEIYSLRKLYTGTCYALDFTKYFMSVNTNSDQNSLQKTREPIARR